MTNPAAASCLNSGGNYRIIVNPDKTQTGKCIYFSRFECNDHEYFKGNGCLPQSLIFGTSIYWWIVKLVLLTVVIATIRKLNKKYKTQHGKE